jgi:hypothetical protein
MIKPLMIKALAISVIGIGLAIAGSLDPQTRLERASELFTKNGPDTFKLLNGQDIGGSGFAQSGKVAEPGEASDVATIINSDDPNAFLFCVRNGQWAAYPPLPAKVGTSAMTTTDADGRPFVQPIIDALRASPNGKAEVRYTTTTADGQRESRIVYAWGSRHLLKRKNDTRAKFFCATSAKVSA